MACRIALPRERFTVVCVPRTLIQNFQGDHREIIRFHCIIAFVDRFWSGR